MLAYIPLGMQAAEFLGSSLLSDERLYAGGLLLPREVK